METWLATVYNKITFSLLLCRSLVEDDDAHMKVALGYGDMGISAHLQASKTGNTRFFTSNTHSSVVLQVGLTFSFLRYVFFFFFLILNVTSGKMWQRCPNTVEFWSRAIQDNKDRRQEQTSTQTAQLTQRAIIRHVWQAVTNSSLIDRPWNGTV